MSQFWLDFDEDDPAAAAPVPSSQQQQPQQQQLSQDTSQGAFYCGNCGSTESYYDSTTGRDVCSECFTQSQQINSQSQEAEDLMDYDDVMGLAAKTAGGTLVMTRRSKRRSTAGEDGKKTRKLPLEDVNQAVPIPDLATCVDGLQRVLKKSAKILVRDLLKFGPEVEKAVVATVGRLWINYLQAYADGAQDYGSRFPELRFSLRDAFLNSSQQQMVLRHLAWKATQTLQRGKEEEDQAEKDKKEHAQELEPDAPKSSQEQMIASTDGTAGATASTGDRDAPSSDDEKLPAAAKPSDESSEKGSKQKKKAPATKTRPPSKRKRAVNTSEAIATVLRASNLNKRQGYKEAALRLKPSMDFCAALLWLAVCKSGVLPFEMVQWMASGDLPLLNAYEQVLTRKQRIQLRPIRTFFTMTRAPSPHFFYATATVLAVACQMKTGDTLVAANTKRSAAREELVFWSTSTLPLVVAKLVANAGLGQAVLNRSLALMDLAVPATEDYGNDANDKNQRLPKPLAKAIPGKIITRPEDILAVVAIACMMDPGYASWAYHRPKQPLVPPYNECHFNLLFNNGPDSLSKYLDFCRANVLDETNCLIWDGFDDLERALRNISTTVEGPSSSAGGYYYDHNNNSDDDQDEQESNVVKPSAVLAGARLIGSSSNNNNSVCKDTETITQQKQPPGNDLGLPCTPATGSSSSTPEKREHARTTLLIEFLAYTAQASSARIRQKMKLFLPKGAL